ncbi:MAG: class II aldolase/adducin family protein, partial [Planctomycetota bacterium]
MQKELSELINISKALGSDPAFVQGSGGNASVKTDNGKYMYVKASGIPLKGITVHNGWRKLLLDSVLAIAKDKTLKNLSPQMKDSQFANRLLLSCDDKQDAKTMPSVDTCLHALLDKYVIHLHPDAVCSYTSAKNGKIELNKLFKNEKFPVLWVPYNHPGLTLAQKATELIKDYKVTFQRLPQILFFEKHGLFVSAKTYNGALRTTQNVIKRCNSKLTKPKTVKLKTISTSAIQEATLAIRKAYFEATGRYVPVNYFYDCDRAEFLKRKDAKKLLSFAALTPDELMVANGTPMWLESCK